MSAAIKLKGIKWFWLCLLGWTCMVGLTACQPEIAASTPTIIAPTPKAEPTAESFADNAGLISGWDSLDGVELTFTDDFPTTIYFVEPAHKAQMSLSDYQSHSQSLGWESEAPSVCFVYDPAPLLMEGQFLSLDDVLSWVNVELELNHQERLTLEMESILLLDSSEVEQLNDNNDVVATLPGGSPYRMCYEAPLGEGIHIIHLEIENPLAPKQAYQWYFEVVPG